MRFSFPFPKLRCPRISTMRCAFWYTLSLILTVIGFVLIFEQRKALEELDDISQGQLDSYQLSPKLFTEQWRSQAEIALQERSESITRFLRDEGFQQFAVYSRVKSTYSAVAKAQRRGLNLDELRDIYGMRVVVPNEIDVYSTMAALSRRYGMHNGSLKNYIARPKASGYQSIHFCSDIDGLPIEFQLRTKSMHDASEAEHEAYKLRTRAA
ncbi:MAG: hypothetical protein WC966_10810 [Bradymonadales bacterium]